MLETLGTRIDTRLNGADRMERLNGIFYQLTVALAWGKITTEQNADEPALAVLFIEIHARGLLRLSLGVVA